MTARALLPVNPDGGQEPSGGSVGPAGPGVPVGGVAGDGLVKTSGTNFATSWVDVATQQELDDAIAAIEAEAGRVGVQPVTVDATDPTAMTADITPWPHKASFTLAVPAADPGGTTLTITMPDKQTVGYLVVMLTFAAPGDATLVSAVFDDMNEGVSPFAAPYRKFLCCSADFVGYGVVWVPTDLIKAIDIAVFLDSRVTAETDRAEGVEAGLQSTLDSHGDQLATLTTAISDETNRATFQEGIIANQSAQIAADLAAGVGRAFRLETVPTGAFTVGSNQSITVTWALPMPDAFYAVQVADLGAILIGNVTVAVTAQDANGATVLVTSSAILGVSTITVAGIQ